MNYSPHDLVSRVITLLRIDPDNPIHRQCLDSIENAESIISQPSASPTSRLLSIYSRRYEMQTELKRTPEIIGYKNVIDGLKHSSENESCIVQVLTMNAAFVLFTTTDLTQLLGVIRSDQNNISRAEELNAIYKGRGFSVSSAFRYSKANWLPD